MNLLDLTRSFSPTVTRLSLDGVTVMSLCKANPLRWALMIVDDALGMQSSHLYIQGQPLKYVQLGSLGNPVVFTNRDWPSFPQQQWMLDPNGAMGNVVVYECIQEPGT